MMIWFIVTFMLLLTSLIFRPKTKLPRSPILIDSGRGYIHSRPFRSCRYGCLRR